MTSLTLTKHHGLGNDFVVAFHPGAADLSALARRLCDRRTGIGADGLLIAE
jgi:diaminopimelate epimerase